MSSTVGAAKVEPSGESVQAWFTTSDTSGKAFGIPAEAVAADRVRILISPPAELNAAVGDIFLVQRGTDDQLWVREKLEASGYCAIRVVPSSDSPPGPDDAGAKAVLEKFAALGVTGSDWFGLIVIDVAPDAQLNLVRGLLETGRRSGWWDYDEPCHGCMEDGGYGRIHQPSVRRNNTQRLIARYGPCFGRLVRKPGRRTEYHPP